QKKQTDPKELENDLRFALPRCSMKHEEQPRQVRVRRQEARMKTKASNAIHAVADSHIGHGVAL
ncbi:MAG: hypothetical protein RI966_236, partial [Actinomycetota bacterium]